MFGKQITLKYNTRQHAKLKAADHNAFVLHILYFINNIVYHLIFKKYQNISLKKWNYYF